MVKVAGCKKINNAVLVLFGRNQQSLADKRGERR